MNNKSVTAVNARKSTENVANKQTFPTDVTTTKQVKQVVFARKI